MQASKKSLIRRALVWLPGTTFLTGLIFFLAWVRTPVEWLRSAFGACFSIFLVFPALFLAIEPDLVIAYINSFAGLFHFPGSRRPDGTILLTPPPRWIQKSTWKSLSGEEQVIIVLLALIGIVLGLVLAANTFGPVVWQWLRSRL